MWHDNLNGSLFDPFGKLTERTTLDELLDHAVIGFLNYFWKDCWLNYQIFYFSQHRLFCYEPELTRIVTH